MAGNKDDQFPEIFNNGRVRIYRNPSHEIFIEDVKTGVDIRLNSHPHGGLEFTTDSLIEPIVTSNMIGWSIVPRR